MIDIEIVEEGVRRVGEHYQTNPLPLLP